MRQLVSVTTTCGISLVELERQLAERPPYRYRRALASALDRHVGVPLTVRLDGRAYHSYPTVAFRDRRRDNAAELAGRARLVFGWRDIREDACGAAREVLTVLHRHGWHGPARLCTKCS
jgi:hypothetical protein